MQDFVDVCGVYVDYPAFSEMLYVMKHSGRAPCSHCSFRHAVEGGKPKYCYRARTNFWRCGHTINFKLMLEQRLSGMDGSDAKFFGKEENNHHAVNSMRARPLQREGAELRKVSLRIPESADGSAIVVGYFDHYLYNVVAPVHLITGICKCLIEAASWKWTIKLNQNSLIEIKDTRKQ